MYIWISNSKFSNNFGKICSVYLFTEGAREMWLPPVGVTKTLPTTVELGTAETTGTPASPAKQTNYFSVGVL
jgi:hypothetical protein